MVTSINYKTGIIFDPVAGPSASLADSLYTGTAPVITNTQQSTSTIASAIKWSPDPVPLSGSDRRIPFNYLGAGDYTVGPTFPDTLLVLPLSRYPNTYSSGQSNHALEFMYYGTEFELLYKYISGATEYRLYINDQKVTDLTQDIPGPPGAGTRNVLKVNLGSVNVWKIRFEMTTMPFGGIFTGPTDTLWPTLSTTPRLMGFGDSITDGSSQNQGAGQGTWLKRFGRLAGIPDTWDQSRGGTGYITPGSFATLPDRAQRDVVTYNPDVIIMWAGYNDQTVVTTDLERIRTAAIRTIDIIQAGVPNVDIIMGGVWQPTGTPTLSPLMTNDVLRSVAFLKDLPFVDMIAGKVYDRFENVVHDNGEPWITTVNASTFVGADNVHPNNAGHQYLAYKWFDAYRALYQEN